MIIPDAGLREYSGHHPAMIEAIANTESYRSGEIRLSVFSHVHCNDEFVKRMSALSVNIEKHFSSDFYECTRKLSNIVESREYINNLAVEYIEVLKKYIERPSSLFLFHTLDWQHAIALSSAISIVDSMGNKTRELNVMVFLMFDPYFTEETGGQQLSINYRIAFKMLAKHKSVKMYASDYEIRAKYEHILQKKIEIHPCILVGGSVSCNRQKNNNVILYLGDAKPEKGFMDLPFLLRKYCSEEDRGDVEFIVQYTISNENEDLKLVARKIDDLAKADIRIKVIKRFVSQEEIDDVLDSADSIVFNYDELEYKYKSSGVLWLAAKYGLRMYFMTNTWLNREAARLGSQVGGQATGRTYVCGNQEYASELFLNMDEWTYLLGDKR